MVMKYEVLQTYLTVLTVMAFDELGVLTELNHFPKME
jgi:hypothetical protein